MNEYKNQILILRNILQKSNDKDLIDHAFKTILPNIFDFIWKITLIPMLFTILTIATNYILMIYIMNYLKIIKWQLKML